MSHSGSIMFSNPRPAPWNGIWLTGTSSRKYPPMPVMSPTVARTRGSAMARMVIVAVLAPMSESVESR